MEAEAETEGCKKCGFYEPEHEIDSIEGSILKVRNWCRKCGDEYFDTYEKLDE
jgi:hypothetical protein